MADVEMRENNDAEAARAWLERAVEAEPDPAWVSRDTGVALGDWAAVPPDGSFDALEWRVPDRLRRLAHVSPLDLTEPVAIPADAGPDESPEQRSEEHTYELQSLMRISYAVFCLKKKKKKKESILQDITTST